MPENVLLGLDTKDRDSLRGRIFYHHLNVMKVR